MNDRLGLPEVIAQVAEVAGLDAARLLAHEKGGQVVYIPGRMTANHWLAKLVGFTAASKIAERYSHMNREGRRVGQHLLIPMAKVRKAELLVRAIEAGGTNNKIAAMTGRHERTVRRTRTKLKNGGMGPLFD